jgi:hypothetical protein
VIPQAAGTPLDSWPSSRQCPYCLSAWNAARDYLRSLAEPEPADISPETCLLCTRHLHDLALPEQALAHRWAVTRIVAGNAAMWRRRAEGLLEISSSPAKQASLQIPVGIHWSWTCECSRLDRCSRNNAGMSIPARGVSFREITRANRPEVEALTVTEVQAPLPPGQISGPN